MNKQFLIIGLLTSIVNLLLNAAAYAFFLKDFFDEHPAGTEEFMRQLNKPSGELIIWALVISALTMGFFITLMIKWSGAKKFVDGLKYGVVMGLLFWSSINFGLYSSSNHFSLASTVVDLVFSAAAMTVAAGFAGWMLGRGNSTKIRVK
jgi:hypothetical protein